MNYYKQSLQKFPITYYFKEDKFVPSFHIRSRCYYDTLLVVAYLKDQYKESLKKHKKILVNGNFASIIAFIVDLAGINTTVRYDLNLLFQSYCHLYLVKPFMDPWILSGYEFTIKRQFCGYRRLMEIIIELLGFDKRISGPVYYHITKHQPKVVIISNDHSIWIEQRADVSPEITTYGNFLYMNLDYINDMMTYEKGYQEWLEFHNALHRYYRNANNSENTNIV